MNITTHQSKDLVEVDIVMSNEEIDALAKVYNDYKKIKSRITFLEFTAMPEVWLKAAESWPERAWLVDFAPCGTHHKLWINEQLSGRTLLVTVADSREGSESILSSLNLAKRTSERPDAILVDRASEAQLAIVKQWCQLNNVKLKARKAYRKPQLKEVA